MWPVSDRFNQVIRDSHQAVYRIDCLRGSEVVASLTGVATAGSVTAQRAAVRRRCDLSILNLHELVVDGVDLTVETASSLFAPYGQQVRVWRGVRFGDGDEELVPLGTFVLTEDTVLRWPVIELEGMDLAWLVSRNPWETLYQIPAGTNYVTAIQDLLVDRMPSLTNFNFPATAEQTPNLVFQEGDDPWQRAQELAAAIGMMLYFDPLGVPTMTPEPDPTSDPVTFELVEGPGSMLLDVRRRLDATDAASVVIAIGEHPDLDTPVRAVVEDLDPTSPTYVNGPFGRRVKIIRSSLWTSTSMALTAAHTDLQRDAGVTEQYEITSMAHPGVEVGDILRLVYTRDLVDGTFAVDQVTIPVGRGTMRTVTRTRQAVLPA